MTSPPEPLEQHIQAYLARTRPKAAVQTREALAALTANPTRASFFRLFALAPRWTGRGAIRPNDEESAVLSSHHTNLARGRWSDDQLGRLWILRHTQRLWTADRFGAELETLFNTADTDELVALYRSLALLDEPRQFIRRAREGARSNILPIFLAVAHHNRYPADYFDETGWNQLVLKAVFNGCALDPIWGLEARRNPALAHTLCDYVRERWAAGRSVPWDLWRSLGREVDRPDDLALLAAALEAPGSLTPMAAALALRDNNTPAAQAILRRHPRSDKATRDMTWQDLTALAEGV